MLHASWRLQLGSARHSSRLHSSSNAWQPAARAAPHRRPSYPSRHLVTHSSNDLAGSTSQAAPANPAADGAAGSPQPTAVNQQQEKQQEQQQQQQTASTPGHPASSSSSTQATASVATADSAANSTSTSSSNGAAGAAAPATSSNSSAAGDYILFTADELLQDNPAPSTGGSDSSSTPAASKSGNDSSSSSSPAGNEQPPQQPQEPQPQQQQQEQQQQRTEVPPLPTHLTVAVGPADKATDEGPFAGVPEQQQPQQVVLPPLIDPDVDIANDPAYAIRLMDILDQIAADSTSSSSGSLSSPAPGLDQAQEAAGQQQQQQRQQQQQLRFVRQPGAFCTNCCTPLDPLRPSASCSTCGHFASDDHLLFSHGASSVADLAAHTPPWLLLQQQKQGAAPPGSAAAAVQAGMWRRQQQQQQQDEQTQAQADAGAQQQQGGVSTASQQAAANSSSSTELDAAVVQAHADAGALLKQAQQQLQEAGVLRLPRTLLAWEDEPEDAAAVAQAAAAGQEPAMHLHRGLLPPSHERPERLRVVEARLRAAGLIDCCERLPPVEASDAELLAVHTPGLIAAVAALSHANMPSDLNRVAEHMAPDALGNRFTHRAARTAAGTAAEMARRLVLGQADSGMALVRPLGHAAGINTTEGGAYFNNAAVAVRAAQHAGARRVMVIDWDIHHCKGTEEIFAEDPNVVVLSLHRYGSSYYPGTGAATDIGVGRGRGRTINVAWSPPIVMDKRGRRVQVDAPPVSDGDYLTAWHMLVLPVVAEFRPDLILVSAGFDAVDKDPVGHYRVHPECFGHLTALLKPYSPLGLLLEGGYNLAATAACVEACLRALLGERPAPLRGTRYAGVTGWSSILRTLLVHQEHWQSLGLLNFLQLASTPAAGPGEWEEEEEGLEVQGQEWEEGEEEEEDGEYEEDEQELQEAEYRQALAAAALAAEAGSPAATTAAADDAPAQLLQLLSAAQQDEELLQELVRVAEQHRAEQAAEAQSKQQREQREQRAAEAAAADASAAFEAGRAAALALKAAGSKGPAASTSAPAANSTSSSGSGGSDGATPSPATAGTSSSTISSSGSSGSSGSAAAKGASSKATTSSSSSSWSAGGFLEDASAVDSGSDDEGVRGLLPNGWGGVLGSTDWGWQQLDEESLDNLPWYEVEAVQQQLKKAEQDAAAAMAAASAAAAAAAAAAAEAPVAEPAAVAAIQEAAVAAVTAEATLSVAVEAAKEAEEAAAAAAAAMAAAEQQYSSGGEQAAEGAPDAPGSGGGSSSSRGNAS